MSIAKADGIELRDKFIELRTTLGLAVKDLWTDQSIRALND